MAAAPVVIVGGGITGLAAAWRLARENRQVTLIEPAPLGGLLRTEHIEGCTVECGADSWIRSKPFLRNLAGELGLSHRIIPCDEARRKTYIYRQGTLHPLPRGLRLVAPTEWAPLLRSRLIGWPTKLRMLLETLRRPAPDAGDRSIAAFVHDHFGSEAVEYLAEPLFAGVHGGTPENLGAQTALPRLFEYERTTGSIIRGARRDPAPTGPLFESMIGGLGEIPQALANQLTGRVTLIRHPADEIANGRVRVGGDWLPASHILLACGAPGAARLLRGSEPGELLARVPHSSATIYAFGFLRATLGIDPQGFGFLVPRKERDTIMAATWVTNKFAHRAPPDRVVLRCFVSGHHQEGLTPTVLADLQRITSVRAEPLFSRVYPWPESMPQYGVGHAELIAKAEASLPSNISIAGAFLRGVGMPDCVRSADEAVLKLES